MRFLPGTWWWLAVGLFLAHQLGQWLFGLAYPPLDAYLDPFLASPILLGLWLTERRVVYRVPRLSALEVGLATLVIAILFEEIFPRYEPGFRRDVLDYLFYAAGAVYYYVLINPPGSRNEG